ncbi:ABC transporter substrate-binding protein [Erysipelothrix rhusiopathiae]|uniref:ABC transporter substrate-binding protein n=1 Tax=Erysipelothrix rhusiopathiae TaxID=1648 RepID=UPI000F43802B|nr:ABC transporter substrate-binding protein [Erysipelothrix rhusiopathiae]AYV34253.1 carbohydrate ABC transporter substrate-binding protein [Erysipelothrix rhusiopathiae]MDE8032260.1 ABC transporter substrate-binding protein [Erysipelothrix rhusiopathiae]MDE8036125.1 ABC transporter substrate-binding protein [Erysipelothrix rhusiopathiae]MDE8043251.1 ABC transporter substrate-binding protein [Erysipelothrix rhusiopathiae]MDE8054398.1 ABC transporter substrate-binding protein [Erysipelothrix r
MKRFTKGVITTAALALLLTGCGKKKDSEEVTIKYWNFPNFTNDQEFPDSADYDAALIKAFEEKNPTIKVEYQKIDFTDGPAKVETAIQSKTNPDVIYDAPGRVIDWASKGYLKEFADVDTKQLDASAVKASSLDNKLYLYPQGIAPFLMAVNTNVTDKLGITDLLPLDKEDNPGRNWTVDEFETFLKAVKEKDPEMIPTLLYAKSAAGDQGPRAFVSNLYGSWITDEAISEYTINNEQGVKGLEWVAKASKEGLLGSGQGLESKDGQEYFKSNKTAISILSSPGLRTQHMQGSDMNARFLPYPNDAKAPKYEFLVAGPAVFDNGDDAKAAAAQKFADFMINDEVWGKRTLLATGNFSAQQGQTGLYDDAELKFAESLTPQFGPYYNTIEGYAKMRPYWFPMLQSVMSGEAEPKAAADAFVEKANNTIKEAQ